MVRRWSAPCVNRVGVAPWELLLSRSTKTGHHACYGDRVRGSTASHWAIVLLTSTLLAACTDRGPSGPALWAQACTLPPGSDELPADQRATALMWQAECSDKYAAIAAESEAAADTLARCVLEQRKSSSPSEDSVLACVGEPHRALIERVREQLDKRPSLADAYRNLGKQSAAKEANDGKAERDPSEQNAAEGQREAEPSK